MVPSIKRMPIIKEPAEKNTNLGATGIGESITPITTSNSGINKRPRRINIVLITTNADFNIGSLFMEPAPDKAYIPKKARMHAISTLAAMSALMF